MSRKLHLTLATGDYESVRALKEGTVRPDGIELTVLTDMTSDTRHWRMLRNREFDIAELLRLFVKDIDKGCTNRLPLLLGVGHASELVEKQAARVAMDQRDVVMAAEEAHYFLALAGSQQAGVNKDTGQLIADRFVQQHGRNRGVDPAGKAADHTAGAHLAADPVDRVGAKPRHRPIAATAGDIMGEIAQQLRPLRRVHDLGMKENSIEPPSVVSDRGIGGGLARRDRLKTRG